MLALLSVSVALLTPSPQASRALSTVSSHPIVRRNEYCAWFAKGEASEAQARCARSRLGAAQCAPRGPPINGRASFLGWTVPLVVDCVLGSRLGRTTPSSNPLNSNIPILMLLSTLVSSMQVKELVVQFSVFSNLFLLAQLNKVINSPTLEVSVTYL